MRAVLDASAFLDDVLYGRSYDIDIVEAPTVIDIEILSAARRLELHTPLGTVATTVIINTWHRLKVNRHGIPRLLPRIWELRHAITTTDASYVALAEALDIPLVTTDLRLARTAERYCNVVIPP